MDDTQIEKWLEDINPENLAFDDLFDDEEIEKLFEENVDVLENNVFLNNIFDEMIEKKKKDVEIVKKSHF